MDDQFGVGVGDVQVVAGCRVFGVALRVSFIYAEIVLCVPSGLIFLLTRSLACDLIEPFCSTMLSNRPFVVLDLERKMGGKRLLSDDGI